MSKDDDISKLLVENAELRKEIADKKLELMEFDAVREHKGRTKIRGFLFFENIKYLWNSFTHVRIDINIVNLIVIVLLTVMFYILKSFGDMLQGMAGG